MQIKYGKLLLVLFVAVLACDQEDIQRSYPRITTEEVSNISVEGALFSSTINSFGTAEITSVGFVWGEELNPTLDVSETVILSADQILDSRFSFTAKTTLETDTKYWVRAFAQQNEITIYGDAVSFVSLGSFSDPIISSFEPASGTDSTELTIFGEDFSHKISENEVTIDGIVCQIVNSSVNELKVIVPAGISAREAILRVTVTESTARAEDPFIRNSPVIESFSPEASACGTSVTIRGQNFSTIVEGNVVKFGDEIASIVSFDSQEIVASVPDVLSDGFTTSISVEAAGQSGTSSTSFEVEGPSIISFSPLSGTDGDLITISGTNFGTSEEGIQIQLGGIDANILSVSNTELQIEVPVGLTSRENELIATIGCSSLISASSTFSRLAPTISSFSPLDINCSEEITISGANFGESIESNQVFFNDLEGAVIEASGTNLQVVAPLGLNGTYNLSIIVAGQTSVASGVIDITSDLCDEGLIAYYPFNGNAQDEAGTFNDGIVFGASLDFDRNGKANSAYNFDGVDDFINISSLVEDLTSDENGAITFWAKPERVSSATTQYFISFGDTDRNRWFGVTLVFDGKVRFIARDLNPILFDKLSDDIQFSNDEWVHIACVQDGVEGKIYVNGVLISTGPIQPEVNEGAWFADNPGIDNARLGHLVQNNDVVGYYKGSLDEVRIYNRALSASQVQAIYLDDN